MKRYSIEEIAYFLNYSYLDARRMERYKETQLLFEVRQDEYLWELTKELYKRTYRPKPPICFLITSPTYREVFAPYFRDRVVSHLLFNSISPIFEKTFIYDSYSCRKGKGTDFGIKRMGSFLKSCSDNYRNINDTYVLSLDISGYFMSIHRPTLRKMIINVLERYKNKNQSLGKTWGDSIDYELCYFLIDNLLLRDPKRDCLIIKGEKDDWNKLPKNKSLFNVPPETGLPIGDITSQLFSNIYLNPFDQFMKRDLGCAYYGRYVDDARVISRDLNYLRAIIPKINEFLFDTLKLTLHPKKTRITKAEYGIPFLGQLIRPYRKYVQNRSIRSFKGAVDKISKHREITKRDISVLNSYLGYFKNADEYKVVQKTIQKSGLQEVIDFSEDYHKAIIKQNNNL